MLSESMALHQSSESLVFLLEERTQPAQFVLDKFHLSIGIRFEYLLFYKHPYF